MRKRICCRPRPGTELTERQTERPADEDQIRTAFPGADTKNRRRTGQLLRSNTNRLKKRFPRTIWQNGRHGLSVSLPVESCRAGFWPVAPVSESPRHQRRYDLLIRVFMDWPHKYPYDRFPARHNPLYADSPGAEIHLSHLFFLRFCLCRFIFTSYTFIPVYFRTVGEQYVVLPSRQV